MSRVVEVTKDMRDNYAKYVHLAITITLKPKLYSKRPTTQVNETSHSVLQKLSQNHLSIYPELTKSDNVHYHAYTYCSRDISFDEVKLKLHNIFRNSTLFGFIDIKQLIEFEDRERWYEYMSKNVNKTIKLVGSTHLKDDLQICSCKHTLICLPYKSIYIVSK